MISVEKIQTKVSNLLETDGKKIGQTLILLLAALACALYFFYGKAERSNPVAALDAAYEGLAAASPEELAAELKSFEAELLKNPTLAPSYQGKAAQLLLKKAGVETAMPLIAPVMKRSALDQFVLFKSFTENTLAIAEGDLSRALAQSRALQENLEIQPALYAHNLVRIALLEKQLADPHFQSTTAAIKEILHGSNPALKEAMQEVEKIYAYKNLSLIQFFDTQD